MLKNAGKGGAKKKKQKRKGRGILVALLLLTVFFLLGFLGYTTLRVAHIAVEGNEDISDQQIADLSAIQIGQHMLSLNLQSIWQAVDRQPFLEVLGVDRRWPDTVVISVRERQRDAALLVMDKAVLIDRTGRVLEIRKQIESGSILMVEGMSVSGFSAGETLGVRDDYQLALLKKILTALYDSNQTGWYASVNMTNAVDIRLITTKGIVVKLGAADDLPAQLDTASKALTKCEEMGIASGSLDVTLPSAAAYSLQPSPSPTLSPAPSASPQGTQQAEKSPKPE